MDVYLLTVETDFEGETVYTAHSTPEGAQAAAAVLHADRFRQVSASRSRDPAAYRAFPETLTWNDPSDGTQESNGWGYSYPSSNFIIHQLTVQETPA